MQIAVALGAEVTAVTKPSSASLVTALGATHVVDHTTQDYTALGARYDVVFDNGGRHSLRRMRRALVRSGTVVLVAPAPGDWAGPIVRIVGAAVSNLWSRRPVRPLLAHDNADDLRVLAAMVEAGQLRSVIDRTFPLADTAAAIRLVESGPVTGKVVIDVDDAHDTPTSTGR